MTVQNPNLGVKSGDFSYVCNNNLDNGKKERRPQALKRKHYAGLCLRLALTGPALTTGASRHGERRARAMHRGVFGIRTLAAESNAGIMYRDEMSSEVSLANERVSSGILGP